MSKQSGVGPETGKQIEVPLLIGQVSGEARFPGSADFLNQEISRVGWDSSSNKSAVRLEGGSKGLRTDHVPGRQFHIEIGAGVSAYPRGSSHGTARRLCPVFTEGSDPDTCRSKPNLSAKRWEETQKSPAKTVESPQQAESGLTGWRVVNPRSPSGLSPKVFEADLAVRSAKCLRHQGIKWENW